MKNPNMVLGIHRYADGFTEDPVIGQRLGPQRVHFKSGRHHRGGMNNGALPAHGGANGQRAEKNEKDRAHNETAPHALILLAERLMLTDYRQADL
jgi:hypothetical protein